MKPLVLIVALSMAIPVIYLVFLLSPVSFNGEDVRFLVPLEPDQKLLVSELKNKKMIRNEKLFNFLASLIRYPGNIEPGAYRLRTDMNVWQVADTLMNRPYQKWIILVPGLRKEQITERLAKKFNWDNAKTREFSDNAKEGYMFPDTYLFNVDYTGKEFAQKMINNFNEHFDAVMQKDLISQNVKVETMLKIASMIERESGSEDDKALISGIIWNRLERGMRLQIDATIQYALGTPRDWWPHVKPRDTKLDSPYNTYLIKTLPPGPICNPSLSSIKAVIYPEETGCLFYLHNHDKAIHCARTYQEHLDNIEKYLN